MSPAIDPIDLASRLIACPSVTPASGEVFDILEQALRASGFEVDRFIAGGPPDGPVENLFASRGSGSPHFGFAGHLDVVPAGDGWSTDPFTPELKAGLLHGRGAVDMKASIAAFVAAAAEIDHPGTLSLIITGDEEGPSTYGTRALMDWMAERGIRPDMILIGEPTSEARLGDIVKIGRRGTVNMWIRVPGLQGHVAYPHRADNPIPKLARVVTALDALHLDDGTDEFQPSNLEFTAVATPTKATNIIPGAATVQLNIRFNNLHRGEDLIALVRQTVEQAAPGTTVEAVISGEAFLRLRDRFTTSSPRRSRRRPACHRSFPPTAVRPTADSSSSSARSSISDSPTPPCISSTRPRRWTTSMLSSESMRGSSGPR